ncbi:hypothetical protein M409DRAFT_35333 [Zasmidium cellare ATCC 36951]|uniref:Fatty acid desaturase domain-containing protein n=1 Tax=Zasmidium cellare ATCC 36951 TaxID=1080233 RepID=A0A6A6D7F5_ZASCE|nr:uncharacterized protein M409DRAFT_35333 [Zasmidium cellare ATCC 36951]KAF2174240.1 hypothetical protein M409DRAFT_35333 [Zasmidium cellare ATCC 36951]
MLLDTNGNEFHLPDFTIKDVRNAIPPECFERSTIRGFGYVLRDILLISATFCLAKTLITEKLISSFWARAALWNLYGFLNGLFATGLWVLAHECGHQAFSPYKTLNDTVGFILHSALLVPYFSWKISHGKHHKGTGHMHRDMVFVPRTRSEFAASVGKTVEQLSEITEEAPVYALGYILARQLFGWPIYLLTNDTGHNEHARQAEGRGRGKQNGFLDGVNHFNPNSPVFDARDVRLILLSDVGVLATAALLKLAIDRYGLSNVFTWYFVPYLWVNNWLVAITFLQHTDPTLPHYQSSSWTFIRGAAAMIDRDFGFIGRHLFHGIIETHVLHHYVSTIPFYNADKATEAIKPVLGRHYRSDVAGGPVGFVKSLYRNVRVCQWVEHTEGAVGDGRNVLFFRNRRGIGPRTLREHSE